MKRSPDPKASPGCALAVLRKVLLVATAIAMSLSATSQAFATSPGYPYPQPRKFYVSKNGNNTDGLTWATAWNEMDQIKWTGIDPQNYDSLTIDGGVGRMIYRKPMQVQVRPYANPVRIAVSAEPGHNGQVVIAPGSQSNGIEITGGVQLNGSKQSGIFVYGAKKGITVNSNAPYPTSVKNIEVSHCTDAGLFVSPSYYPLGMSQLILHDNATNVVTQQTGAPGGAQLSKCWIYNSSERNNFDGIRIDGSTSGPPTPSVVLNSCVLGPGLRDGINNLSIARPSLTNCLLINSRRNNISSYSVNLQNVTSFMTRLNPSRSAHSCIKLQASPQPYNMIGSSVKKTIAYGGMVDIPISISYPYPPGSTRPFPITVEQNTQYSTTGNTTALAPTMVDPKFVSHVRLLPNHTPVQYLMGLDFSLRPDSPALGTGSEVTSIKQLLRTFD